MDTAVDRVEWDEVEQVVEPIIKVWFSGSELRWAEHAWATLTEAGLAGYGTEMERTRCVLRAVALGAVYRDFCARAFGEGSPDEWTYRIDDGLIGPYPLIDAFTLGQLVEHEGIDVDSSRFDDGRGIVDALQELVRAQYQVVWRELRARCGDADLFVGLFASAHEDTSYPLSDEQAYDVVNNDATPNKMIAWEWLTE